MKKILIVAFLFVGCEGWGVFKHEHDGICFDTRDSGGGSWYIWYECYPNDSQVDCGDSGNHWVSDMTCEDFCANEIDERPEQGGSYYMPECKIK
jgi:hypothetical protein